MGSHQQVPSVTDCVLCPDLVTLCCVEIGATEEQCSAPAPLVAGRHAEHPSQQQPKLEGSAGLNLDCWREEPKGALGLFGRDKGKVTTRQGRAERQARQSDAADGAPWRRA